MIYRFLFLLLIFAAPGLWASAAMSQSPSTYPELTQEVWETMGKSAEEQFRTDAIILFHTLFPNKEFLNSRFLSTQELEQDKQTRDFLKRLIITIAFKGLQYTPTMNGKDLKPYPHNIASIFGHGGRILITLKDMQTEDGKTAKGFLNYLATGDFNESAIVFQNRKAATHGLHFDVNENRYIEDKLKGLRGTARNLKYGLITGQHLGMDLAIGGIGNKLNGNTIWVGGEHLGPDNQPTGLYLGHLYLFTKDTQKMGKSNPVSGLLIGLEASGAGKTNAWKDKHTAASGMQDSSKLRGVFGGNKWGMLKLDESKKANLYGGKRLELTLAELYELDHYIETILKLPEEQQKEYFWYFLNNAYEASRPIFNR